jgi:hypothetical protein
MTVSVESMCIISVIIVVWIMGYVDFARLHVMPTVIIIYFLKQRRIKRNWGCRTNDGCSDSCLEEGDPQQTSETHHEHTLATFDFTGESLRNGAPSVTSV